MRIVFATGTLLSLLFSNAAEKAAFREQDVDTKVEIGYGLAIADVNGDKKQDILLADKNLIVWYQNPNWTKHIIAEKLTELDHVCIAAADIDGDGKAEVAAGAGWNPGDTVYSGALFYLIPPADRTQKWEPVPLHHEPTVHRIKWVRGGDGRFGLASIPLHGRGNKNAEGASVKHEFYHVPKDVKTEWKRTLINEDLHVTHNFDVLAGGLLIGGKEAINLYAPQGEKWVRAKQIIAAGEQGFNGAGEVRQGKLAVGNFIAAVEPFHGNTVAVYMPDGAKFKRTVLDESLIDGHAIAVGDFLGRGSDQFVIGWRGRRPVDSIGVKLFVPNNDGTAWTQQVIDAKGMACEDLAAADLNGDGKLDLIAAGRATKNVKVYWNESK